MKKRYITLSFVVASMLVTAQNKATKKADKLFQRLEYVDAASQYLDLVNKGKADAYVYKQLADSYYNVFNAADASKWYEKAISEAPQDAETYYHYSQMLKAQGKYEQANKQMQQFAQKAPNDQRAKRFLANPDYIAKLNAQPKLFDDKMLDINSEQSDFGMVLTNNNEMYFASARNESGKKYGWNNQPYLDIYKATYNSNGTVSEAIAVEEVNTKWHDGPASISADGNTMYFASESFKDKLFFKDKEHKLRLGQVNLYKATKEAGKWTNITALPFNSSEHSTGSPSISKDGKTLYFTSNMEGGMGGTDIWKVSVNGNEYGTPENLGSKVNTAGNENFPFITEDNTLYFSSDGKQGYGGMDIYRTNLSKNTEVENLGKPVNTAFDDFSFSYSDTKKIGFFASNRTGKDNLYSATPVCGVQIAPFASNAKTGEALAGVTLQLLDNNKKIVGTATTDNSGNATFNVACEQGFTLQASKNGFESAEFEVTKFAGGKQSIPTPLQPIEPVVEEKRIVLQPIYFEYDKSNITQEGAAELDKLVAIMKANPNMIVFAKSHTDTRGEDAYNIRLSERRAKSTQQYIISQGIEPDRIQAKGFGESEPKIVCDECSEEQHALNRTSEFIIVKE